MRIQSFSAQTREQFKLLKKAETKLFENLVLVFAQLLLFRWSRKTKVPNPGFDFTYHHLTLLLACEGISSI